MRILFLAPQPFFQERGTPIAVRLALKVLSKRKEDRIDLLTFAEGQDVAIDNVKIHRIWSPGMLRGIRPGFSFKKLVCDFIFFLYACNLIINSKLKKENYALIHAVEESVFMALIFKFIFGIPYIYDMDSSLAMQLIEKLPYLKSLQKFFDSLEAKAISNSLAVIPVCDALAEIAQNKLASHVTVLPDIALASEQSLEDQSLQINSVDLKTEIQIDINQKVLLYVGNLEYYQGVELLIDSFAIVSPEFSDWHLVIIGGNEKLIRIIKQKVRDLGLEKKIHLVGPRPVSLLSIYLKQADILASPRIMGNNTPMKIYSYMHSAVPIVATNISSHTQVLNNSMAKLVNPDKESFSSGLRELFADENSRSNYAKAAFDEAEAKYTFSVFTKTLLGIYESLEVRLENRL